jgi:hypothetical protein
VRPLPPPQHLRDSPNALSFALAAYEKALAGATGERWNAAGTGSSPRSLFGAGPIPARSPMPASGVSPIPGRPPKRTEAWHVTMQEAMARVLDNLPDYEVHMRPSMTERFHLTPEMSTLVVGQSRP